MQPSWTVDRVSLDPAKFESKSIRIKSFPRENSMRSKLMLSLMAGAAVMLFQATPQVANAQGQAALTGQVTSDAEGAMEGVVVTAHKDGSPVQTSER